MSVSSLFMDPGLDAATLLQASDGRMVLAVENFIAGVRMLHAPCCRQPADVEMIVVDSILVAGIAAIQYQLWV